MHPAGDSSMHEELQPIFYLKPNCSNYMFDICLMMVVSSRFINYFPVFPLSCSVWNASGLWHETFRLTLLGIFFFKHLNLKHIRVQHHIRKESIHTDTIIYMVSFRARKMGHRAMFILYQFHLYQIQVNSNTTNLIIISKF